MFSMVATTKRINTRPVVAPLTGRGSSRIRGVANNPTSRVILRPPMFALQPEMKVFSGSANRELAQRICNYIGTPLGQATISSFADGETYVKIEENIRGRDVFIIQPTSPPTNEHLMEFLIMVDAARRASADRITAVIPFLGTRGRTAKISRACPSQQSSWRICFMLQA